MFYLDSNLISSLKFLPVESIGRIIKKNICEEFTEDLNEIETPLYLEIKSFNYQKKIKRQKAINKRWQKVKEEKQEKTQKEDLPKKQYNNFKPFPSVTTNKQQNNKSTFTNDYLKTGVIKL